jgi:peptide/nickel transport system substrate-binding protein
VVFRPIVESTVRLANLTVGQPRDDRTRAGNDLPEIKADAKLRLATVPELGYQGITLNIGKSDAGKAAFGKDARVIQAFNLSLDREAITKVAFNGEFLPAINGSARRTLTTRASSRSRSATSPRPRSC